MFRQLQMIKITIQPLMKFKPSVLVFSIFICLSCQHKESDEIVAKDNTYDQLIKVFSDPPSEYRSAPFWVWNKDVSKADIDRTLRDFKKRGFGGVFLHPRYGMITAYLSPRWFELVQYSRDVAKELDLKLWIYDENSYPSGFAGGLVNEQMPESYNQGVALVPHEMDTLSMNEKHRVKYVFKKVGDSWQNITATASKENGLSGGYIVFTLEDFQKSKWFGGYSYVDLLLKGVTEKFIDITFSGYKHAVGEDFGKTIPGIFSDEPNTDSDIGESVRWTPGLASRFRKRNGYDLESGLVSMIRETGNWRKVRHDYYATILELFIQHWSIPMSAYCKNNNLLWTGHYWEHGWPSPIKGPDNMAMYAYHQIPGIDLLYNSEILRPDQFGNIRSVKELSSVVNQFGCSRALCEMYGGSGWEFRFDEMKRNGDWAFVLGVNLLNQHLSLMSLAGDRKFDYPQSFGPYSPYWNQYSYQINYFGRLSAALSSGKQTNRILVLEPTTTAWMYYSPESGRTNKRYSEINPAFRKLLGLFEQKQVEYDLGDENIIRDYGKVSGNKFCVSQCSYDIVIVPDGMDNFEKPTFNMLKKFVAHGGKVIQLGEGARYIGAEPAEELVSLTSCKSWTKVPALTSEIIDAMLSDPDFTVHVTQAEGQLYHHRRHMKDGQVIFFTNYSEDKVSTADISVTGASVEELSAETGKVLPVAYKKSGNKVIFPVTLYPSGSYMVYVFKDKVVDPAPALKERSPEPVQTSVTEITCPGPNILSQDYLTLKIGNGPEKELYFKKACDSIFTYFGFSEGNPWFKSSQFKTEILDRDKNYKKGDRFEVTYNFELGGGMDFGGVKLVVEQSWLYEVSCNGTVIRPVKGEYWLDPEFSVFEVEKLLKKGKNAVRLIADPFSIHCEIEPVYLLGNFALESARHGWRMIAPKPLAFGSWKAQGMPYFGQSVKYSKTVRVDKAATFRIELHKWFGTVATVSINGREAGIIQARPYVFTTELSPGDNRIDIVVTGSLKNTFGPHHVTVPNGVGGRPVNFTTAPEIQPEGNAYSMIDYGLMDDFTVQAMK
jgi:hypothetical protein